MRKGVVAIVSEAFQDVKGNVILFVPLLLTLAVTIGISFLLAAMVNTSSTFLNVSTTGNNANLNWASFSAGEIAVMAAFYLFMIAVEIVGYCWLLCMASEVMQEGGTSMGSSLAIMKSRLPAFIGTSVLIGVIGGLYFLFGFFVLFSMGIAGVLLFMIAWIVLAIFLMLAIPATIVGELGPFAAVADSFGKAKANFGRLLAFIGLMLVLAIGTGIIAIIVGLIPIIGVAGMLAWSLGFGVLGVMAIVRLYGEMSREENPDTGRTGSAIPDQPIPPAQPTQP